MALNLTLGQEALVQDSAELLDLAQEAGHLGLFECRVQKRLAFVSVLTPIAATGLTAASGGVTKFRQKKKSEGPR